MKKRILSAILILCLFLGASVSANAAGIYSNDDLCSMARQYYQKNNSYTPGHVDADHVEDGKVVIHLYDVVSGHTSTCDWYYIDPNTAKGTSFFGETIDLTPFAPSKPVTNGFPFSDVKKSDSYYDSILYVYQNGLFSGTAATTFSPNSPMNRGMLATVLYRLAGKPAVSGYTSFKDIKSGAYYEDAVTWASACGIVNGTTNTTFSPQNLITHEQMAVLLYRYAVLYLGKDASGTASLNAYPDGGQVGVYAQKAMQWCASKGLITGSKLSPKTNATRAEVAEMLYRLSKLPQGAGGYKQVLGSLLKSGSSCYYDIDGNGTEELLSIYSAANGGERRAAVYSIQNGRTVRIMDETMFWVAGEPYGELGAIEDSGNIYLCTHTQNYGGDIDEQHRGRYTGVYKIYSLSNTKLSLVQEVEYNLVGHGYMTPPFKGLSGNITITENGQTQTVDTAGFLNWLNSWTWKTKICDGNALDGV